MMHLYLVYGTWYGDGETLHGNILGVFRDVNAAEDAMIKAARESFDYYDTPADCRFCDYYDLATPCDRASKRLYRIIAEDDYTTDLCLLHYEQEETFSEEAYVVWGTEDYDYCGNYYPVGNALFSTVSEAIAYAAKIECDILEKDYIPVANRHAAFLPGEEDGRIFEIGDAVDLTSWITVERRTIQ